MNPRLPGDQAIAGYWAAPVPEGRSFNALPGIDPLLRLLHTHNSAQDVREITWLTMHFAAGLAIEVAYHDLGLANYEGFRPIWQEFRPYWRAVCVTCKVSRDLQQLLAELDLSDAFRNIQLEAQFNRHRGYVDKPAIVKVMAKQVAHHCPDVVGLPYVSLLEGRTAAFDTAGGSNVHRAMGFSIDIAAISNQCSRAAAREECAICCYRQNSTTLRICGNTFCEACINVWLNGSGSHGATGSCPICRTDLTVPQAEVQQYPRLEAQQ